MTTQEIVSRLWNLCNVLRDDGITYHQYVTELTYILFLKMAKETGAEEKIPEAYRWDNLKSQDGVDLKKFYKGLLDNLGEHGTGRIKEIYQGATTNIDEPKNLSKIIKTIDELDWFSAREEGLGNLYEGLLEKNANEKKSGAGQYFTPRVLIDVMTRLMKPQPGERCNDPACGTFGFMIAAHQYVSDHTDQFFDLDADMAAYVEKSDLTAQLSKYAPLTVVDSKIDASKVYDKTYIDSNVALNSSVDAKLVNYAKVTDVVTKSNLSSTLSTYAKASDVALKANQTDLTSAQNDINDLKTAQGSMAKASDLANYVKKTDSVNSVILTSSNGSKFRLVVSDTGELSTIKIS